MSTLEQPLNLEHSSEREVLNSIENQENKATEAVSPGGVNTHSKNQRVPGDSIENVQEVVGSEGKLEGLNQRNTMARNSNNNFLENNNNNRVTKSPAKSSLHNSMKGDRPNGSTKRVEFADYNNEGREGANGDVLGKGAIDYSQLNNTGSFFSQSSVFQRFQDYFSSGNKGTNSSTRKAVHWEDEYVPLSSRLSAAAFRCMDMLADSWPLFIAATATAVPIGIIVVSVTWIMILLSTVALLGVCLFVAGGCLLASMLVFPLLFSVMGFISLCGGCVFGTTLVANFTMASLNRSGTETPGTGGSPYAPATPLATPNVKQQS